MQSILAHMAISDRILLTTELRGAVIAAARTAFLLVGIASTAFILASTAVPYSADLLSSSLPRIRTLAFAWISPSYLFIAVHFIIIVIWKLHDHNYHPTVQNEEETPYLSKQSEIPGGIPLATVTSLFDPLDSMPDPPDSVTDQPDSAPEPPKSREADLDEPHDTMDATWKAILERGAAAAPEAAAARPRMKKSDTWERCGHDREGSPAVTQERIFRKSNTFRRVSVGREELYMRAEALIRTHQEQLRIQRQESERRFVEMVNAAC